MTTTRKADAVLVPRGYGWAGSVVAQHRRVNALLGPACGCRDFWWSQQDGQSFGIPRTSVANYVADLRDTSLYFGQPHPLAGRPRYTWFHAEAGSHGLIRPAALCEDENHRELPHLIKLGFRVPDPAAGDPALGDAAAELRESLFETRKKFLNVALNTPDLYEKLKAKLGVRSDAEMEAMFGYVDRIVQF